MLYHITVPLYWAMTAEIFELTAVNRTVLSYLYLMAAVSYKDRTVQVQAIIPEILVGSMGNSIRLARFI